MEEEKPNYYAIIPATVRYDERLKDKAKLLYGEIIALSNANGECWASNEYFSNLYDIVPETTSRIISELVEYGYLEREIIYKTNSKEIDKRILIPIDKKIKGVLTKKSIPIDKKINTYCQKNQEGIDKKIKDNNTSINNTSINNNISLSNNKLLSKDIYSTKQKFGEYHNVKLTKEEYEKLKTDYENIEELIKFLDEYIEMKGYKAKSHYLCIKKWVVDAVKEKHKKDFWEIEDE